MLLPFHSSSEEFCSLQVQKQKGKTLDAVKGLNSYGCFISLLDFEINSTSLTLNCENSYCYSVSEKSFKIMMSARFTVYVQS